MFFELTNKTEFDLPLFLKYNTLQSILFVWRNAENMSEIGSIIKGKVQKILPRGAIVILENGKRGFVHVSEIADGFVERVEDFLKEGESVNCRVLGYDERGRMELSIKRAKESSPLLEEKLRQFRKQSEERLASLKKKRETNGRGRR